MKKRLIELAKELEKMAIDADCSIGIQVNPWVHYPTIYAIHNGPGHTTREIIDDIDLVYAFRDEVSE